MSKNYTIITGYWNGKNSWRKESQEYKKYFFDVWYENTIKYSNPKDIFVINSGSEFLPEKKLGKWVDLSFNLGHVHDLDNNDYYIKKFGGWSMSFIIGAYICYANNTDMIYKEQDCLAFNQWVDTMYDELEKNNKKMLFGNPSHSDNQGLEQSLFLIKHESLLNFVNLYTSIKYNDSGVGNLRPEMKFRFIIDNFFNNVYSYIPFGFGRSRPNTKPNGPYYFQQINESELKDLI